ncbi:MAG: universal stress protein UspE [Bacteroidota bacterium]|jgi:nucleotide-binding universal stress UspA family protein|nr:universal stress protein UspE [Bacteroidota bacterium]
METFNIKKILVPVDFSETSMKALDHAVYIAKLNTADITLLNVVESTYSYAPSTDYTALAFTNMETYEKEIQKQAKDHILKLAQKIKKKEGVNIIGIVSKGWVKEEILDAARSMRADIIIMGTHGVKGFREFITGSNTFRVVNEAQCPVLSVQKDAVTPGFKNILVPFRDKPHSREKVDYAIKMAELYGAKIFVLGIDMDDDEGQLKKIELEAAQIKRIIEKHGLKCTVKVKSSPYLAEKILKYAKKKGIDLIVIMADLDRMQVSEFFMGPFAQQMVNHSPIPVLSIRPTFNPNTVDLGGYGW